jgi:putative ABC transport system ATP-binding protein
MPIFQVNNVKRGYRSGGNTFWALKGVTLSAEEAGLTILRGRSGSGKTTLMNIMGALDVPTEGEILYKGKNISNAGAAARDALRRREFGFVFQSVALVSMMTAFENVEFGLRVADFDRKASAARAEECLRLVGLSQRSGHMPPELSGGEQQRVAIARAIAHRPSVVFADEPTAELDTRTALLVAKALRDLVDQEKLTVVMSTHDAGLLEIADRVYELDDGLLIEERTEILE